MKSFCLAVCGIMLLAGCAAKPQTTAGLGDQIPLHPVVPTSPVADDFSSNALVYKAPDLNMSAYRGFYLAQATIYQGQDAKFGNADGADQQEIAAYLTKAFGKALLSHHLRVVAEPGPHIVTLQLILAGVSTTHPIASLTRLTPIGAGITVIKSAAGLPAAFVGSITLAGALTDNSGKALGGFVVTENPLAYDLRSSLGTVTTAEVAADRAAGDFAAAIVTLKKAP